MGSGQLSINGGAKIVAEAIFSAPTEQKAKERLEQLLEAETTVRVRQAGDDSITYERVPDNPVRLAAAVKIIEWNKGKPRQSVEVTKTPGSGNRLTAADLARIIRDSPGVVDEFIGTLKTAQAEDAQSVASDSSPSPSKYQSEATHSKPALSVQMLTKPAAKDGERSGQAPAPSTTDHATTSSPPPSP